MYSKKHARIEPLTQALAKEIASMPGFPGERDIRPARLKFLRDHVKEGTFVGPDWAIATNSTTGETFRINGQHSSNMLASLEPEEFPNGLIVIIAHYEFTDMATDGADLFDLFDNPRSARTDTDFMSISRAHWPEFKGIDNGYLVKAAAGIDVNIHIRAEKAPDAATKQRLMGELYSHRYHGYYFINESYRQFAMWLYQWKDTVHFSYVVRSGIVAEALSDWLADQKAATEFWDYVFRENHPDPDHETRELVREYNLLAGKPKRVPADEWAKRSKKYWNKFLRFRIAQEAKQAQAQLDIPVMPPPQDPPEEPPTSGGAAQAA